MIHSSRSPIAKKTKRLSLFDKMTSVVGSALDMPRKSNETNRPHAHGQACSPRAKSQPTTPRAHAHLCGQLKVHDAEVKRNRKVSRPHIQEIGADLGSSSRSSSRKSPGRATSRKVSTSDDRRRLGAEDLTTKRNQQHKLKTSPTHGASKDQDGKRHQRIMSADLANPEGNSLSGAITMPQNEPCVCFFKFCWNFKDTWVQ